MKSEFDGLKNKVLKLKKELNQAVVVCYVNSSAAVKAESDICCTSANAINIVEPLPEDELLFIPDQHLGHYVSTKTEKRIILYLGFCPPHRCLQLPQLRRAKQLHPECGAAVIASAGAALCSSQTIRYAREIPARSFLIGTEEGLLRCLRQENPEKDFFFL